MAFWLFPQELSESPSIKGYMHCSFYPLSKSCRAQILVFHQLLKCAVPSAGNCLSCLFLLVNPSVSFKLIPDFHCPEQPLQPPAAWRVCCSTFCALTLHHACLHCGLCHSLYGDAHWEFSLVKISVLTYLPHSYLGGNLALSRYVGNVFWRPLIIWFPEC